MRLQGKRIGILIESDYYEPEIWYYQQGHEFRAPFECRESFEDIERLRAAIHRSLQLASVVAAFVLIVGLLVSIILARRVTEPVAGLTDAAAAVEAKEFDLESLADVATRTDERAIGAGLPKHGPRGLHP